MNIDLSSGGVTTPCLVAAALAALVWYLTGKKTDETPTGFLGKLQAILASQAKWLPIVTAVYQHRNDLRSYLEAFLANNFQHPDEKKTGP